MPINRAGLPHAAASTSRSDETPTTSRTPPRGPLPDAQPSQNNPAAVFDGLSAMPPELRQQVVSRLSTRSMARLGATSRQMAADFREGMQTFLTEHPHYDPVADVGYVDSAARLRVALRMIRNLPYRDGEGRGPRLRAYAMYVERLRTLAQSERMEAAVILAEHVGHLPDPVALPVLENLACDMRFVPEAHREMVARGQDMHRRGDHSVARRAQHLLARCAEQGGPHLGREQPAGVQRLGGGMGGARAVGGTIAQLVGAMRVVHRHRRQPHQGSIAGRARIGAAARARHPL